jgi:hypothetical protein
VTFTIIYKIYQNQLKSGKLSDGFRARAPIYFANFQKIIIAIIISKKDAAKNNAR